MRKRLRNGTRRPAALVALLVALIVCGVLATRQVAHFRVQNRIDTGIAFARSGQPINAEREWLTAAKLSPDNATVWELLGELYLNTEQWSKGAQAFQNLLRVAPNQPQVYSRLAACMLRSGNELEAQKLANEQLKRDPNDEASLTMLAFLSDMQDRTDEQIGYLQRLLARSPKDPEALRSLLQAYNKASKFAEMLPVADRLLAVAPNDGLAYAMRGAARLDIDSTPQALAQSESDLLRALSLSPLSAYARYMLGKVYLRQGKYAQAAFQLETAQKIDPRNMQAAFDLATAYARSGQAAKATLARKRFEAIRDETTQIDVLQKRCSLSPNDFDAHLQLGQLFLRDKNLRLARIYLTRAFSLRPDSRDAKTATEQLNALVQQRLAASP